jgi:hypothetical protein
MLLERTDGQQAYIVLKQQEKFNYSCVMQTNCWKLRISLEEIKTIQIKTEKERFNRSG